jgi:hypothetical protein
MIKHYFKVLDKEGHVIMVGYGYNEGEISKEEYERLREEILAKAEMEKETETAVGDER